MSDGARTDSASPANDGENVSGDAGAQRFGRYVLLNELGRGAQGVVWLAEDVEMRRKVALKLLATKHADEADLRERFRREAELASKLDHPGICGVRDFGSIDGVQYIAMQYVRGSTLGALVKKSRAEAQSNDGKGADTTVSIVGGGNKGGIEDVLRLIERAARALHVAHEAGLVHRDCKPANVMVTPEGHPVWLDFGLARDVEGDGATLTQSGQILGTPAYLAPEQIVAQRGRVDRRTDVYALGVMLFECLTLRRPYEGKTWDELFHQILEGAPPNARKLNPRIPRDLATVIEVAMERTPARRYPTAEAFAEDLRRVRAFEPIQAKPATSLQRLGKWSRRRPAVATAAAAGALFAITLLGVAVTSWFQRSRDLRSHLTEATNALGEARYVEAAVAVAKARELDPESRAVQELKDKVERAREQAQRAAEREKDLASAAEAREEAARLGARHANALAAIEPLRAELVRERAVVFDHPADEGARTRHAAREAELAALGANASLLNYSRREALDRAARLEQKWGEVSEQTQDALADFYVERWREAITDGDENLAATMRAAVEEHDPRARHRLELLGRGTLAVNVLPAEAELFLFRWERYETVRDGVIPRRVPVPTSGVGRVRPNAWSGAFHPGDVCLEIDAVNSGSPAERAGLRRGDLVLAIDGVACDGRPFLSGADGAAASASSSEQDGARTSGPVSAREGDGAGAHEPVFGRVDTLDGARIGSVFGWRASIATRTSATAKVAFVGRDEPLELSLRSVTPHDEIELLRSGAPVRWRVECLRDGEPVTLELAAGVAAGLTTSRTAYPRICARENRIAAGAPLEVDPGSYLVVARAHGRETERLNVLVERRANVAANVELLREGELPPGCVRVLAGPSIAGGDANAFQPRERRVIDVPEFFIARKELSNGEWYDFVNDPATLAKRAQAEPGVHLYLPEDDRVLARASPEGGFTWDVYTATSSESPVLGLSWNDVRDYLAWRNRLAEERNEPWRYDLPSEDEWEKAARGVDGREFPWGSRFDPALTVCLVREAGYLLDAPGGFEPRDESPYGVLDMAGSREEWLRDVVEGSDPPRSKKRGGHWGSSVETVFRCASRGDASVVRFASSQGLRLVARRANDTSAPSPR